MEINNIAKSFMFLYCPFKPVSNVVLDLSDNIQSYLKRIDNKLLFSLDEDGYVNGKFKWLNLDYPVNGKYRNADFTIFVNNNKYLEQQLEKIFTICNLLDSEIKPLIYYWMNKLSVDETEFYKCEIFYSDKVDKYFEIKLDSSIEFVDRIYVRFTPTAKKGKDNLTIKKFMPRYGNLKLIEVIGYIDK